MNEAKNTQESTKKVWNMAAVVNFFSELYESIQVVTIIYAFICLLLFGLIIAPVVAIAKWAFGAYSKYYDWLFDWYTSKI